MPQYEKKYIYFLLRNSHPKINIIFTTMGNNEETNNRMSDSLQLRKKNGEFLDTASLLYKLSSI